jgi:hypothetical protein
MTPDLSYKSRLSGKTRKFRKSNKEFIVTFKGQKGKIWEKIVDFFTSDYANAPEALKKIRDNKQLLLTGLNEDRGFGRIHINEGPDDISTASDVEAILSQFADDHEIVNYAPALIEEVDPNLEYTMYRIPGTFVIQLTKEYLEDKTRLSDVEKLTTDLQKKFLEDNNLGDPLVDSWTPGLFELPLLHNKTLQETLDHFNSSQFDGIVKICEPNFCGVNDQRIWPNESMYLGSGADCWGVKKIKAVLKATPQPPDGWNHSKITAVIPGGSKGVPQVKIAVVDTGAWKGHNDLGDWDTGSGCMELKPALEDWDFRDQYDKSPNDDYEGTVWVYHGTNVCGVIGANSPNGMGAVGVAPGCKILPLRVNLGITDMGTYRERADAINYIGSNVSFTDKWGTLRGQGLAHLNIINNLGFRYILNLSWEMAGPSDLIQTAIESAVARNVLVVCAAGEDVATNGRDIGQNPVYPAAYSNETAFPNAGPGVIAVAASTQTDARKVPSNYGANVVYAPGQDIYTTTGGSNSSYTTTGSGTSMAAAFVSGAAALIYTANHITHGNAFTIGATTVKDVLTAAASLDPVTGGAIGLGRININKCISNANV